MLDDFMVRAALAGLGTALATGPLGCFVVWRRMAYFGDATAHAAVLGVALALILEAPIAIGVLIAAGAMAFGVATLGGRTFAMDTLLGVAAHGALATGLVAVAITRPVGLDLEAYLFGDILAVGVLDIAVIWAGAVGILALLAWRWSALLTATISPDLAHAAGTDPARERLILTLALAVAVALALKVVGALLITALLIIPAATARLASGTPEAMAGLSVVAGASAVLLGLGGSYLVDSPTGPTIVSAGVALFLTAAVARRLLKR